MQPDKIEEIKKWLSLADESLNDAKDCLVSDHLKLVQNRLYYSMFYAVKALALKERFITSKHKGLSSWFNQNYIKTGVFSKEMGKLYNEAFDNRHECDYTVNFIPNKEELTLALKQAKDFIDVIKKYINAEG